MTLDVSLLPTDSFSFVPQSRRAHHLQIPRIHTFCVLQDRIVAAGGSKLVARSIESFRDDDKCLYKDLSHQITSIAVGGGGGAVSSPSHRNFHPHRTYSPLPRYLAVGTKGNGCYIYDTTNIKVCLARLMYMSMVWFVLWK